MSSFVLALDQGTTSSRAIVFDHAGQIRSSAQREFPQYYPRDGWVEHDPMEIWSTQSGVAAEALSRARLDASDIAAVGITNQRETTVVWNADSGQPVYPAIVWQDRRTSGICRSLRENGHEETVISRTGLRLDPYFSATKIAWILDHVDGARAQADQGKLRFGTIDSWLLWLFSDGSLHATDASNASRTLLYNIHQHRWDPDLLELFSIPDSMLPEVRSSSGILAEISRRSFPAGVPMAGIAGDQQAALFGQACFAPGMAKNTYGTGCFLLMNTGGSPVKSSNNLLTTVAWRLGDHVEYALEGSVFNAGSVVQWLRDGLQLFDRAEDCDSLAATVADSNGVFFVPAFTGLGAPYWDPDARGTIVGLNRGVTRAHLCRAGLESIAFQTADLIRCMEADAGLALKELRVDGGASRSMPLLQMQADFLQSPVVRPTCVETTALGAAYLAGLAVGYWQDQDEISSNWAADCRLQPEATSESVEAMQRQWQRAVERATAWAKEGN